MKMRNTLAIALVALVAVGILGGCSDSTDQAATTSGQQMSTDSVEMSEKTGANVGDLPPVFTLPDLDGNEISLADFKGKVIVLDLWATWCPPCREEIPFLIELYDEFEAQGLEIIGIGLDQGGAADIAPFVERNGVDYTILVGTRSVGEAYRVSGIPTTFIIGRDGRIAAKHVGFANELRPEMRSEIETLLADAADI